MIAANELRIGNIVVFKNEEKIKAKLRDTYHRLTIDDIAAIDEGYDAVDPIPLTPEILEKAGFKQPQLCLELETFSSYDYTIQFCYYSYSGFINLEMRIGAMTKSISNRQIKYIHELQNAYKELTGKELEINLL